MEVEVFCRNLEPPGLGADIAEGQRVILGWTGWVLPSGVSKGSENRAPHFLNSQLMLCSKDNLNMRTRGHAKAGTVYLREERALPTLLLFGRYRCVYV